MKDTQKAQGLAHRKDSDSVSCYYYEVAANSPKVLSAGSAHSSHASEGSILTTDRS